jgi:hypothetical protein
MHGRLEKPGKTDKVGYDYSGLRLVVIPALLAIAVAALAIKQPDVSRWLSEAAQAEFANSNQVPEVDPPQVAQPDRQIRTVKAD